MSALTHFKEFACLQPYSKYEVVNPEYFVWV